MQEFALSKRNFSVKKTPRLSRTFFLGHDCLLAFVTITAGTLIRRAITGIAHVNGAKRTILTCIVVTATRHVTTNALINRSFNHKKFLLAYLAKSSICKILIFY